MIALTCPGSTATLRILCPQISTYTYPEHVVDFVSTELALNRNRKYGPVASVDHAVCLTEPIVVRKLVTERSLVALRLS